MRHPYTAPLLILFLAATSTTTHAQNFFTHLPVDGYGGGWQLNAGENGGVRLVSSLPTGGELVLGEAGNIISGMILSDDEVGQPLFVSEMVQVGTTERLALGQMDNGTGTLTGRTMYLARIIDGATSTEATTIGPEDNTEWSSDLALHPDGAVVLGRTLFGPVDDLRYRMIVAKFDADLTPQWGVTVDVLDKVMFPVKAFVDPASGAITTYSLVDTPGPTDFYGSLVKLSSAGELLWSYSYDCEDNGFYNGGIVQDEAGDFYTVQQLANFNTLDLVLSKITADGELLWSKKISAPQPGRVANVYWHNGAIYVAGTAGFTGGTQNALVVKLDTEGQAQWAHVYGVADRLTVGNDLLFTTGTDGEEALWLSGYFRLNGTSPQDVLWMKLDADGTGMDCSLADYVFTTTPTTSTTIEDGVATPYTYFGTRTLGINTFAAGEPVYECGAPPNGIAEAAIALAQVAPVPTHGPCTVSFPAAHGALRTRVLNALGQQVQEHSVAPNAPTLQLDLGGAESGTYVLLTEELKSGRRSAQRVVWE